MFTFLKIGIKIIIVISQNLNNKGDKYGKEF